MTLRSVRADRLALALAGAQVRDEPRAEQQPDRQRGRARRAGAEADVADQVEQAGEAELFGDQVEHGCSPPDTRSTSLASPTELDALTSTASPGRASLSRISAASSTSAARSTATSPASASASGFISSPIRINRSTRASITAGASPACSESLWLPSSRIGPSTAMRRSTPSSEPRLFRVAAIDAGLAL